MTARVWSVEESLEVPFPPRTVYAALADVRRMTEWSTEVIGVWRRGERFVGVNRKAGWIWFTTCRIVVADPGREFAFDVTTFRLPVARWGYRLTPEGEGTRVTEYWVDQRRRGWRRWVAEALGLVFTGTPPARRAARNRAAMRVTLHRLAAALRAAA
ncbi:SRPBCC family protein [Streptomyces sioyaensis]|uniref:SRPBCC family protein n=1 Tax=Streptomyces sioyaensis TaxID=67364 RepID=A0A4Q1RC13_9ACTN|nr:SRPBCC family protein [Streptomyces sioyaensis]MBM4795762.1 SRPBCC family protein [Streptomyces sioyaensis]RXS71011.1 SRPBCC family protein [Streptomyces sioyaensis]